MTLFLIVYGIGFILTLFLFTFVTYIDREAFEDVTERQLMMGLFIFALMWPYHWLDMLSGRRNQ